MMEPYPNPPPTADIARGVGAGFIAPMLAASIDNQEVRGAVRSVSWAAALVLGGAIAAGVALGIFIGRAVSRG